jgi:transcriptional activator HAC1
MESWDYQTPSPDIKFENSPAESFLSTPGEAYPSLFGTSAATTMDPHEMMTPQSTTDDKQSELSSVLSGLAPETPMTPGSSTTSEKKQTKKRKSWGQVLPEPKTNLPPR